MATAVTLMPSSVTFMAINVTDDGINVTVDGISVTKVRVFVTHDRVSVTFASSAGSFAAAAFASNRFEYLKPVDRARPRRLHPYAHLVAAYVDNGDQDVLRYLNRLNLR